MLLIYVWGVPDSNLSRVTSYSLFNFIRDFPLYIPTSSGVYNLSLELELRQLTDRSL